MEIPAVDNGARKRVNEALRELIEDSKRITDKSTGLDVVLPGDTVLNGLRISVISTAGAVTALKAESRYGMLLPWIEVVTETPRILFEAQEGFFLPGLGRMPLSGPGKLARLGLDYPRVYVVQGHPERDTLDRIFQVLGQVTLIFVPLETRAGRVQVLSRVVEDALFQLRDAGVSLNQVRLAVGKIPLLLHLHPDEVIMHLGEVYLEGDLDAELAERVALPEQYRGRRFRDLAKSGGFSDIDRRVFSPAKVTVCGRLGLVTSGRLEEEVISWPGE